MCHNASENSAIQTFDQCHIKCECGFIRAILKITFSNERSQQSPGLTLLGFVTWSRTSDGQISKLIDERFWVSCMFATDR